MTIGPEQFDASHAGYAAVGMVVFQVPVSRAEEAQALLTPAEPEDADTGSDQPEGAGTGPNEPE